MKQKTQYGVYYNKLVCFIIAAMLTAILICGVKMEFEELMLIGHHGTSLEVAKGLESGEKQFMSVEKRVFASRLGEGIYFYDDAHNLNSSDMALKWAISKKRISPTIIEAILILKNCFDVIGNINHKDFFDESMDDADKYYKGDRRLELPRYVIGLLKDQLGFTSIRAPVINGILLTGTPTHIGYIICVYNPREITNIEII